MASRIGFFGGSFDPIHLGHVILAVETAHRLALAQVQMVPSRMSPHKAGRMLESAADRLEMVKIACRDSPLLAASDMEIRRADGPSYTIESVAELTRTTGVRPHLILGEDSLRDLHTWHRAQELVSMVEPVILRRTACRPDEEGLRRSFGDEPARRLLDAFIAVPVVDVSSTSIRARIAAGEPWRHLVPAGVAAYIEERNLYRMRNEECRMQNEE